MSEMAWHWAVLAVWVCCARAADLPSHKVCIANRGDEAAVRATLTKLCANEEVNCTSIEQGGQRHYPNTDFAHGDYVFEQYYKNHSNASDVAAPDACALGAGVVVDCITSGVTCRNKAAATEQNMTDNLYYLCGPDLATSILGERCTALQPGGEAFLPNTIRAHADWALDQYYQVYRCFLGAQACDFSGTGEVVYANATSF